ncbi:MAG: glycoside hydrolase family 140 protein [Opitutaceae bacterium]|nr:glycoside hydrolase family 140 protein [Opitutaceae bacterium]
MHLTCRVILLAALIGAIASRTPVQAATALPALKVSENQRFLVTADGKPFFYLGDTAWELFHRLNREQAVQYLDLRAKQRYTVIQAVALAELEGLADPNAYGDLPLIETDPGRPAVTPGSDPKNGAAYDYWDHVDFIVNEANRRGIYIGFLPTWGRWVPNERKEDKQIVFNAENAGRYGKFLGERYRGKGIIWVLGGDRSAQGIEPIWRAMAKGIAIGVSGQEDYSALLMTFHPRGGLTSSTWFHGDPWLDFNMQQTGHSPVSTNAATKTTWQRITDDYQRTPVKPVLDGEPLYEDHPIGFRAARENGYSFDAHVRQRAYWHVFAGACGHTYGHHSVWQMYSAGRKPINGPLLYWHEAIHRPGADQMRHVRALIESRPILSRVPDQSLVVDALKGADFIAATRGDGYAFIYSAQGRTFMANLGKISGPRVVAWWFNPRNGAAEKIGPFDNTGTREFVPHIHGGFGTDMVLVLDDAAKNFPAPGTAK